MSTPAKSSLSSSSSSSSSSLSSLDRRSRIRVGVAVIGHAALLDCLAERCSEKVTTFNMRTQCWNADNPNNRNRIDMETLGVISSQFPATDFAALSKLSDEQIIDDFLRPHFAAAWLETSKQRRDNYGIGAPRWKSFLLEFAEKLPVLFRKIASDKDQRLLAVCEPPSKNQDGFQNLDINIPSGKIEEDDHDRLRAALRELSEECHLLVDESELPGLSGTKRLKCVEFEDPAHPKKLEQRRRLRIYILQLQPQWNTENIQMEKKKKIINMRKSEPITFSDTEYVTLRKVVSSASSTL